MPIEARQQFPPGFLWGCATAAHQVEGGNVNDWSEWEKTPGRTFQNQPSNRACEWWAGRYLEDFDHAAEMHNNAQRLSVEWSRIEPEPGKWNEDALEQYRAMLKALHERGMKPMVTLHHFTNPLWLGEKNWWLWDEVPTYFERFVRKVVSVLGEYCNFWCTINEPQVYAAQSYSLGKWPPGLKSGNALSVVLTNTLIAHAAAYNAIKELQLDSQVGIALHIIGVRPRSPAWLNQLPQRMVNYYFQQGYANSLITGTLDVPLFKKIAVPKAKGTLDWIGLQYYNDFDLGFDWRSPGSFFVTQTKPTDMPVGPHTWGGLNPDSVAKHVHWLHRATNKPVYITESGVPDPTDTIRPGYLLRTIYALWHRVNVGFPVKGYFFWSLVDNFEWAEAYDPRYSFGLYQVNFETQQRTPRLSARLYGEICAANGISAEMVRRYAPELTDKLYGGEQGKNDVQLKVR